LYNTQYNKEENKLQIEKVNVKNKKVVHKLSSVVDVLGVGPSELMKLYIYVGYFFSHSNSEQKFQNIKLKKRISELKEALSPKPLFAQQLAILSPDQTPPSTPGTSNSIRKVVQFLNGVRFYVVENINIILEIITHAWEVNTN